MIWLDFIVTIKRLLINLDVQYTIDTDLKFYYFE